MTFTINGTSILPYIAAKGLKWQREDVDGPNAGRGLDGTLIRDRVATKYRADVTCKPLTKSEAVTLLALLANEWVTVVTDTNPHDGGTSKTYTMYSNNIPSSYAMETIIEGIAFPLIQQ